MALKVVPKLPLASLSPRSYASVKPARFLTAVDCRMFAKVSTFPVNVCPMDWASFMNSLTALSAVIEALPTFVISTSAGDAFRLERSMGAASSSGSESGSISLRMATGLLMAFGFLLKQKHTLFQMELAPAMFMISSTSFCWMPSLETSIVLTAEDRSAKRNPSSVFSSSSMYTDFARLCLFMNVFITTSLGSAPFGRSSYLLPSSAFRFGGKFLGMMPSMCP
mmetsp:Transcript_49568/g.105480  ORF Transcript_49568/g.105480 Transcript_49568/m.105480 type:complete len:223 (-) Transcript_49568:485-1153(-)